MKSRNRERGMTIPMVALFIVVLFAMAALAVDLGVLYSARTSAQHAADAAALAGAFTFTMVANTSQPPAATEAAIAVAAKTKVLGTPVSISAADVSVDIPNRRVTVTVPRKGANGVETLFAKAIGWNKVDVQTTAIAEAAKQGSATSCLKPFFVPNTILSSKAPDAACLNPKEVLFDTSEHITTWATTNLSPNTVVDLTPAGPSQALTSSQFYLLDFASGGSGVEDCIAQCLNQCGADMTTINCDSDLPVEPGGKIGPIKHGVDQLIGNPADTWAGKYNGEWTFHPGGNTSVYSDTSSGLVIAPVWDNCTQPINPGKHGQKVKVVGFVRIFITGTNGKAAEGHIITATECALAGSSGGGSGSTGANTGPYGIPVRLVNPTP